jgi:hypothetical protein
MFGNSDLKPNLSGAMVPPNHDMRGPGFPADKLPVPFVHLLGGIQNGGWLRVFEMRSPVCSSVLSVISCSNWGRPTDWLARVHQAQTEAELDAKGRAWHGPTPRSARVSALGTVS